MTTLPKRVLAVMLATSVTLGIQPKPAQSNPAVLAPALCATGVGCVLIGAVTIGGALYYVWEYGGGKRLASDAAGNIMRMLDDPEGESEGVWEYPLDTRDVARGDKICRERAQRLGASYTVARHPVTKKIICVFTGGTGR